MEYSVLQPSPFSLLPRTKAPWKEFALSSGTQACIVALLIWLRLLHPGVVSPTERTFRSVQLVSTPVPVNHEPQRMLKAPALIARIDPPVDALRPPPAPPIPIRKVEVAPAPNIGFAPKNLDALPIAAAPVIPKVVRTNLFSSGSSAPQTTVRTASQVQTGGFGDPNGVPAKENLGKPVNLAASGSFDLPSGAGSGNGAAGSTGVRGVVASAGFGNGTATQGRDSSKPSGSIQQSGFGDAGSIQTLSHSQSAEVAAPVVPAEIISKPTPVYTQEARNLRIEGEVLLEVVLQSSGGLRVVRVVRGLGHGLDDNAVKAAEQIRFKPAVRNGQPTDSTIVLHIIFQMA